MKIAVVDDHDLIREGLNAVLTNNGAEHVEKFGTAMELIKKLDSGDSFDFYVIDLELPDIDGMVLIEMLRARNPVAKIIISTLHDEIWTLRKLMARDVNGIIYKSGDGGEIVAAIKDILGGNNYYCEPVRKVLKQATDSSIHPSVRELEVLHHIAKGKTSREIAAAMFVTDNTIEAHRKSLFAKLGAVNVADLIVKAIDKGYLKKSATQR
ncbi:MAG: response regulator transcription factor [Muribaculaceae bacterium]|nr:response regulator transcription factor [Muribaculaceae bacterium]MDE6298091.1 response regulator transcription factor [Muribaculaceae bacterium]